MTIESLVQLFPLALNLTNFDVGVELCLEILRKHKAAIPKKKLPELLNNNHDLAWDLIDRLDHVPAAVKVDNLKVLPTKSVSDMLAHLRSDAKSADFDIQVGSCAPVRCHSWVLYSRWPYFRHMLSSNMKEASNKKLLLPAADQNGGMAAVCIDVRRIELAF